MSFRKLTLTSKKFCEPRSDVTPRKSVKECYCCGEVNKPSPRSSRTQQKHASPCHCRSHPELGETDDKTTLSSISNETFRRIQRLDYTPTSQFLRNVQNKICEFECSGQGDHLPTCPRSSRYHRFMANMQNTIPDITDRTAWSDERKQADNGHVSPTSSRMPANLPMSEQSDSERDNVYTSAKEVSLQNQMKTKAHKTLRSKRQVADTGRREQSNLSNQRKQTTQSYNNKNYYQKKLAGRISRLNGDARGEISDLPEYCERRDQCFKHDDDDDDDDDDDEDDDDDATDDTVDQDVTDLRNFREQNYFETHGSNHTLASTKSSGSLQQYMLNERLFPEPVGKIHKQNLVVTMPPCTTMQKKRIHYFPRYIVPQEKNDIYGKKKRRRCQMCPLTGHAIDLGVLKVKPPLNSLALKYQKRMTRNGEMQDREKYYTPCNPYSVK